MTIAVVIPAFNEEATIAQVAAAARRFAETVIVVDDGSADRTVQRLAGLPVTVLRHPTNQGKAASLWDGMRHALAEGAKAVITLDGDGQHDPADIPRLVAAAGPGLDRLVIAARVTGRERAPRLRRFANAQADFWISWAAGQPIQDSQSGFRLYPAAFLSSLDLPRDRPRGFVFESEILIEAGRRGLRPVGVAIDTVYAAGGRPSHYRPATDTWRIVCMVAGKLLARGMDPKGLLRSLRLLSQ